MGPDVLVPLAGMLTGVFVVGALAYGVSGILRGPVGQALARRISGRSGEADAELVNEVVLLRQHVEQMEHRLIDAEERLDFNERLLAQRSGDSGRVAS